VQKVTTFVTFWIIHPLLGIIVALNTIEFEEYQITLIGS